MTKPFFKCPECGSKVKFYNDDNDGMGGRYKCENCKRDTFWRKAKAQSALEFFDMLKRDKESMPMSKRIITYEEYSNLLSELVYRLKRSERIKRIKTVYGVPRGGLPIAVHLSHAMGWNFTSNPFYDHYENTIVVDDIADTGVTLKKCGNLYTTATLFYKPRSDFKPDFYIEITKKWIVFPWEHVDEIPNRPDYN